MKAVELSVRMQALANMVSKGRTVCDVGCDHGWVSIWLVQKGIASKVYAMDVRSGPLERAREHIRDYHLETYIETRLSDGLSKLQLGEADCMVCAGMGGPLMVKILTEGREKAQAMKELILQPQSEIKQFREFLRGEGYRIVQEDMVFEEGKYYPMMKVVPARNGGQLSAETTAGDREEQILWDTFGEMLLKDRHPILVQYLDFSQRHVEGLLQHLEEQGTTRAVGRLAELEKELELIQKAKEYKV